MSSNAKRDRNLDRRLQRMFDQVDKDVTYDWGPTAFARLGPRLQRALLAEAVLSLVFRQDESISAETVRKIAVEGWRWANEQTDNE